MHMYNGRAAQIGAGNNQSNGFYGVGKLADTVIGPDGTPITVDTGGDSSVTLDYSQGFAAAPGAPGSSGTTTVIGPSGTPVTVTNTGTINTGPLPSGIQVTPIASGASSCSTESFFGCGQQGISASMIFIGAGIIGLFIMLSGGRR